MMARGEPRGTTLVELLVVLVVLGLLAAVGAGSMTSLREPQADAQVHALRRARAQAIQRGVPVLVQSDSGWTRFLPDGRTVRRSDGHGDENATDTSRTGR